MKRWTAVLAGVVALALVTDLLMAQPPRPDQPRPGFRQGGQPGGPGGQPGRGMQGGMRGGMQGMRPPLLVALDADGNGEISAEEIAGAAKALKTLDKNGDGKLTADEIRPSFGGPPQRGPGQGGPPQRGPGQGGPGQGGPSDIAERLMGFDKNKDGKVTKDEMPERMQRILQFADTNKDGAIDKAEAEAMGQRGRGGGSQRGPGAGGRPGEGRGPGEGRRPGGGGDRPQRPPRPSDE